jgi:hypothetical protein
VRLVCYLYIFESNNFFYIGFSILYPLLTCPAIYKKSAFQVKSTYSELHVGRYRRRYCTTIRLLYKCYMQCALNISRNQRKSVIRIPSVCKLALFIYQLMRRCSRRGGCVVLFVRDLAHYLWACLCPAEAVSLKASVRKMMPAVQGVTSRFNRHAHNDFTA